MSKRNYLCKATLYWRNYNNTDETASRSTIGLFWLVTTVPPLRVHERRFSEKCFVFFGIFTFLGMVPYSVFILQFPKENLFIVFYYHTAVDYILLNEATSLTGHKAIIPTEMSSLTFFFSFILWRFELKRHVAESTRTRYIWWHTDRLLGLSFKSTSAVCYLLLSIFFPYHVTGSYLSY